MPSRSIKQKSYLEVLKQKSRVLVIFLKIYETNLNSRKKSSNLKGYFVLSSLLVSDFLLCNVLFWSSIKNFKVPGSQILESWVLGPEFGVWSPRSQDPGLESCALGPGSWVLGPGSWILDPGSWVLDPQSLF